MRKVIIKGQPDSTWRAEAEELTNNLLKAKTKADRDKIIDDNEGLWRDHRIRDWLLNQFNRKCWYTESQESVSPYHVDHFRPKGKVIDGETTREGYWWLAFRWTNYRIAGQLINVKKKDRFPLEDGRQAIAGDENSLIQENFLLLDPTDEEDASLVSFESNGEITPAAGISDKDLERVELTRDIYGLNRLQNLNDNRAEIWRECKSSIQDYEKADSQPVSLKKIQRFMARKHLKRMIRYEAKFSSVALACLRKEAPESLYNQVVIDNAA